MASIVQRIADIVCGQPGRLRSTGKFKPENSYFLLGEIGPLLRVAVHRKSLSLELIDASLNVRTTVVEQW